MTSTFEVIANLTNSTYNNFMTNEKSIILIGIKHCGKSTQAKALAQHYNCKTYDTDDVIKELTNKSPREIYNSEGRDSFISAEKTACQYLSSIISKERTVIATGGGLAENEEAARALSSNSIFVYLYIDEKTACDRIISEAKTEGNKIADQSSLPSYIAKKNPHTTDDVRNIFHTFYEERTSKYEMLCDIKINQKNNSIEKITNEIISKVDSL